MMTCRLCGRTWPRDPALAVPCPTCYAPTGRRCRRPSGHGCDVHRAREIREQEGDRSGLYPLDVGATGLAAIAPYAASFFG